MKTKIITLAIAIVVTGIIATSCDSPQKNVDDATEKLADAQVDLRQAKKDSIEKAEWNEFKVQANATIVSNNLLIMEQLDLKNNKGTALDPVFQARIDALQAKNQDLQKRIDDYEKYHSNWATFKREFDHDMEELGKTIREVKQNNSK